MDNSPCRASSLATCEVVDRPGFHGHGDVADTSSTVSTYSPSALRIRAIDNPDFSPHRTFGVADCPRRLGNVGQQNPHTGLKACPPATLGRHSFRLWW